MAIDRKTNKYLEELERVKKQYEQYLEISEINSLPVLQSEPDVQYMPPSIENPLTSNTVKLGK